MPSWNDIFQEMQNAGQALGIPMDLDGIRRAKIRAVEQLTERPLIVYAVDMSRTEKTANQPTLSMINYDDKDGFIEAMQGIAGDNLDILLQSPGGLAEATESIVVLIRNRFKNVRFIIPSIAKSAATMLAMSGDELLLSPASELGPIDPQLVIGGKAAAAQAILEQFQMAKDDLQRNPGMMPAWLPILQQYGPALLQECQHYIDLPPVW
jgi:ClpP class serine protease